MPTVRLLGPVDVIDDHGVVHTPGSPLRSTLVALLALQRGVVVDTDALVDQVWDGRPPPSGRRALRFHVSRLRAELGVADLVVTVGSGYRLDADTDVAGLAGGLAADVDLDVLGGLLGSCRGDPFSGASACSVLDHERRRLDELIVAITERFHQQRVAAGDPSVIADLTRLCLDHPVRESLWAILIRAHYQAGNQADALRTVAALRMNLRDELGVDPSRDVQQLELDILEHDLAQPAPISTPRLDATAGIRSDDESRAGWLPRRLRDAARSSCVGREIELQVLQEAWVSVTAGRRQLALVSGEPGIGKTRLVAELATSTDAATIAYGWCDPDSAAAYFPWSSIVRSLHRCHPDVLATMTPALATEIRRLVPELGPPDLPAVGDASMTRQYLFDAIDTFLAAVAARRAVLVVIDDVHWADAGTLAIIRHLLRSDRDAPLLIVGTYRDTDVDRTHPLAQSLHDLQREPGTVRVSLGGLQRHPVGALIADRAGHAASEEFVDRLYDETGGNPYFVEEVLAHLVETGTVVKNTNGDWVNTMPISDVGVPDGIRDALGRRLSRLPTDTNDVLAIAAVVGREFDLTVVAEVASLTRLDVIEQLEPALDARLVHLPTGTNIATFAHALVRESLLDELRITRRTRLHWLIGKAFTSRPGVAPAVVAHHFCEGALAGDVGEAAAAAMDAADAAVQLGATDGALTWSGRAIEVLGDATEQYPELYNLALYNRGIGRIFSHAVDGAAGSDLAAATSLALDRGDHVLALRALALAIRATPQPTALETLAARTVCEAPAGTACAAVARGLYAFLAAFRGHPFDVADAEAAVEALDSAIPLDISWYIRDGFLELLLGLPDLEHCRDVHLSTLALGERHQSPLMIGMATMGLCWMSARCADRQATENFAERVRTNHRERGWKVVHLVGISLAMADGRLDDAEDRIHDASDVCADTPLKLFIDYQSGVLAHLRGSVGLDAGAPPPRFSRLVKPPWEVARRAARDGDRETARSSLAALMPHSLDELRKPLPIMNVLVAVAEAAALLRDATRAAILIPALEPYAGQMAIGYSLCELKFPVSSVLGRLRAVTGEGDAGVEECEAGLGLAESMQTRLLAADSAMVLADTLLIRGRETDIVRARQLLIDAIDVSDGCGAYGVGDLGRRLLGDAQQA